MAAKARSGNPQHNDTPSHPRMAKTWSGVYAFIFFLSIDTTYVSSEKK
jgi:hypothetical protein